MSIPLLKPGLYERSASGVVLLGGICVCGNVFFPMQSYGCERCGRLGAALQPKSLRGSGTLLTASIVHMHADKRREVPFAVGSIVLDDGPVIRTLLSDIFIANDATRQRVEGELVSVITEDGMQAVDLRFKRETQSSAAA